MESGIATLPHGFWGLILESYSFMDPCQNFWFLFSFRNGDFSATIPKFTNTQITEHYSTCIKLSTENVSISWLLSVNSAKEI